jgi:hypothetical protein
MKELMVQLKGRVLHSAEKPTDHDILKETVALIMALDDEVAELRKRITHTLSSSSSPPSSPPRSPTPVNDVDESVGEEKPAIPSEQAPTSPSDSLLNLADAAMPREQELHEEKQAVIVDYGSVLPEKEEGEEATSLTKCAHRLKAEREHLKHLREQQQLLNIQLPSQEVTVHRMKREWGQEMATAARKKRQVEQEIETAKRIADDSGDLSS